MWKVQTRIVPVVIGRTGVVSNNIMASVGSRPHVTYRGVLGSGVGALYRDAAKYPPIAPSHNLLPIS